jgi:transposase-like protein
MISRNEIRASRFAPQSPANPERYCVSTSADPCAQTSLRGSVFQGDSGEQARQRLGEAIAALDERLPKVAAMLADSEEDILAFYAFPQPHWSKLRSANPLERFNKGDGPAHRRRRRLPRRPLADPARRHALPRAE